MILQEWKQFILQKQPEHALLTLGPQDRDINLEATLRKIAQEANSQIRAANKRKVFRPINIIPGDHILLCSDGIHDNLTNDEIGEVIKQIEPTTMAQALVERALERSRQERSVTMRAKPDDMTAVVITYQR